MFLVNPTITPEQMVGLSRLLLRFRCLVPVAIWWWCWMVAQVASPQPIASTTRRNPDHRPRPLVAPPALARMALGSQGIRVGPADLPTPSPSERRKLLRDALRFTLWRATGSTVAWLDPQVIARKRAVCGV